MKARHRTGPTVEQKLKQLEYQIVAALESIEAVSQDVEEATSQRLETYEQVSIVGNLNVPKKVKDVVIEQLLTDTARPEDIAQGNIWGLYQTVNEQRRRLAKSIYAAEVADPMLLEDIMLLAA